SQDSNYNKLRIVIGNGADNDDESKGGVTKEPTLIEYRSNNAITFIDDNLSILVRAGIEKKRIIAWLESLDVDDHFFSLVRRFYLLVKLIDDKVESEKKAEQYELLINMTDEKLLTMIVILCEYFDWANV
ncbi:TPA: hypothetical protein J1547_004566, partial [Escherichia coli]|nr:hypothetical protein [Escherichia coli]